MKTQILFLVLLISSCSFMEAQRCEDYKRDLFHMLPDTFPNMINCIDSSGLKQGWWIKYKILYNSIDRTYGVEIGEYVSGYSFGKYKDDMKIGDWISIENVHQIYETRRDRYYYSEDTILVSSGFFERGWNESTLYLNSDSSLIKFKWLREDEVFPVCIDCSKYGATDIECKMTYRGVLIKDFPFEHFDLELYCSSISLGRKKKIIDSKLD